MRKTVTVITPTYNRAGLLEKLYLSLESQTVKDFLWLIIDDGSIDNTKSIVEELKEKASFPISYIYKNNGGKHTALNEGIKGITSVLTMIVDSDDRLLPNAIEDVCTIHEKYMFNKDIGAYCFLRCYSDGNPIVSLEEDEFVASYIKYRIKENRPGDMAEVFKTEVLKEFKFPEFPGEKFLSEDVVWIQIGMKYKYVFVKKSVYQCEYLEGGLTANDKAMKFSSPLGSMLRGKMLMHKECGFKQNIKGAIIYNCYKKDARSDNKKELELDFRSRLLCFSCKLVSSYYYKKWKEAV